MYLGGSYSRTVMRNKSEKSLGTRVNVLINIFGDFRQFSAKEPCVFLNNVCYDIFPCLNNSNLRQNRQFFLQIIWQKYFSNHM
jgi:hypothetical protein